MKGGYGEGDPDGASQGEGDDVAEVGLFLMDEMKKQVGSGEADEGGCCGAEDLGAVEAS